MARLLGLVAAARSPDDRGRGARAPRARAAPVIAGRGWRHRRGVRGAGAAAVLAPLWQIGEADPTVARFVEAFLDRTLAGVPPASRAARAAERGPRRRVGDRVRARLPVVRRPGDDARPPRHGDGLGPGGGRGGRPAHRARRADRGRRVLAGRVGHRDRRRRRHRADVGGRDRTAADGRDPPAARHGARVRARRSPPRRGVGRRPGGHRVPGREEIATIHAVTTGSSRSRGRRTAPAWRSPRAVRSPLPTDRGWRDLAAARPRADHVGRVVHRRPPAVRRAGGRHRCW